MITRANAIPSAIAWVLGNKAACTVAKRLTNLTPAEVAALAEKAGITCKDEGENYTFAP